MRMTSIREGKTAPTARQKTPAGAKPPQWPCSDDMNLEKKKRKIKEKAGVFSSCPFAGAVTGGEREAMAWRDRA